MGKPISKDDFIVRHSAYFQQLGFDMQFAGCIYYLLDLSMTDRLEYETDDDFVIYRNGNDDTTIKEYYQVKHTKNSGERMTDADSDFWKTIDNWVELYNLSDKVVQKNFFVNAKFIIITNKKVDVFFYTHIENLQKGLIQIKDIQNSINDCIKKKPSYVGTLEKLNVLGCDLLNQFLHHVQVIDMPDFLAAVYEKFLRIYMNPSNADLITKELVGELWTYKLNCGGKFQYTGESFTRTYKGITEKISLADELTMEQAEDVDPKTIDLNEAAVMIEQLKCINEVAKDADTSDYTLSYYLAKFFSFKNILADLQKTHVVPQVLEDTLDRVAISNWNRVFLRHQGDVQRMGVKASDEDKEQAGRNTLYATLDDTLEASKKKADRDFSNGWYFRLSNMWPPKVVWHIDWFRKHIKK